MYAQQRIDQTINTVKQYIDAGVAYMNNPATSIYKDELRHQFLEMFVNACIEAGYNETTIDRVSFAQNIPYEGDQ